MSASKPARGASVSSTSVKLPAIPAVYQTGVSQVILESVRRDYDEYHGVRSSLNEASREASHDGVRLNELLEQ